MNKIFLLGFVLLISCLRLFATTPEQEKAFVDSYKTAFEAGDTAKLESFLYTPGANPMALEFYKTMMLDGVGGKITSIELVNLTPEEARKAAEVQDGPGGQKFELSLKPGQKLKISVEHKDANGSSSSSTESFVAEKDGKLVIPLPADAK